jgi:hypothetical protein
MRQAPPTVDELGGWKLRRGEVDHASTQALTVPVRGVLYQLFDGGRFPVDGQDPPPAA